MILGAATGRAICSCGAQMGRLALYRRLTTSSMMDRLPVGETTLSQFINDQQWCGRGDLESVSRKRPCHILLGLTEEAAELDESNTAAMLKDEDEQWRSVDRFLPLPTGLSAQAHGALFHW